MNIKGSVVLLTLDTEMTPDVLHEVVAVGVTDLFGNTVLGPYDRASFMGFRPARPLPGVHPTSFSRSAIPRAVSAGVASQSSRYTRPLS